MRIAAGLLKHGLFSLHLPGNDTLLYTYTPHDQSKKVAIEDVCYHEAGIDELVEASNEIVELRILAHEAASAPSLQLQFPFKVC